MTLAEAVRDIMLALDMDQICRNEYGVLDEAYDMATSAGRTLQHPLDRHKAVLKAVSRSKLFTRVGYIQLDIGQGLGERLYPCFALTERMQ